jgi:rod shape-determining protein MreC
MRRKKNAISSGAVMIILVIVCIMILFISYISDFNGGVIGSISNYVFVPMQKGLSVIEESASLERGNRKTIKSLREENKKLQTQVNDLNNQLNTVQLQQSELEELQKLYSLDQQYTDYKKTGARVIARGTSNWFNTFTINKGSSDGIKPDMNVIADGGLVGIVTETGKDYAIVRAIIDDTSNVSAMSLNTGNICIVSGSLEDMTKNNTLEIKDLEDPDQKIASGEPIVTSNVSSKYLPGLLIGYVNKLKTDPNGISKSGSLTPAVDFKHLQDVLVILTIKESAGQ